MANVFDVAEYVLRKHGEMTTMKLQKLVYYSQAWSLVWDEDPLFPEANGPVVRALYEAHRASSGSRESLVEIPAGRRTLGETLSTTF